MRKMMNLPKLILGNSKRLEGNSYLGRPTRHPCKVPAANEDILQMPSLFRRRHVVPLLPKLGRNPPVEIMYGRIGCSPNLKQSEEETSHRLQTHFSTASYKIRYTLHDIRSKLPEPTVEYLHKEVPDKEVQPVHKPHPEEANWNSNPTALKTMIRPLIVGSIPSLILVGDIEA